MSSGVEPQQVPSVYPSYLPQTSKAYFSYLTWTDKTYSSYLTQKTANAYSSYLTQIVIPTPHNSQIDKAYSSYLTRTDMPIPHTLFRRLLMPTGTPLTSYSSHKHITQVHVLLITHTDR